MTAKDSLLLQKKSIEAGLLVLRLRLA